MRFYQFEIRNFFYLPWPAGQTNWTVVINFPQNCSRSGRKMILIKYRSMNFYQGDPFLTPFSMKDGYLSMKFFPAACIWLQVATTVLLKLYTFLNVFFETA